MVALSHDNMQVRLAAGAGVAQPALEDVLGLFDELAVEVDGVRGDVVDLVLLGGGLEGLGNGEWGRRGAYVFTKDEFRGLLVVGGLLGLVALAFFREGLGLGAVAAVVGFAGLGGGEVRISVREGVSGGGLTRSKHDFFLSPSARARSRSRSYSASASLLASWLKAGRGHGE